MTSRDVRATVIATVYNEEKTIGAFLEALLSQSRLPDEIVITDGGSTDETVEKARRYQGGSVPIRVLVVPGNRSVGRNAAVQAAQYPIIACSDAGCVPAREWLENLVRPFEQDPSTALVSGFMEAKAHSLFQACNAALMLSTRDEIDPATWLPSSRSVAFTKEAWAKAGGYPEQLSLNEDTPFDKKLLALGYRFRFAPNAVVYWEPRSDLSGFSHQYYDYSRGDGQGNLDGSAYARRAVRLGVGLGALFVSLRYPLLLLPTVALTILYLTRRCLKVYRRLRSVRAFLLAWVLAMTYDVVSVAGFFRGWLDRAFDPRYQSFSRRDWS